MAARATAECAFADNGQYLANISSDGRLKIWESGSAKQEYTPASHLSATCTCLVWAPFKHSEQSLNRIKKKRKSNGTEESAGSDVIALGTSAGTILLYSVNRGAPQKQLTGGHSDKIHGLCWNHTGTSLFSCSADRKIVEWDVVKGVISSQWKVDKSPIFRMAVLQDNQTLVTGGHSIQCWNVTNHSVTTTFTGHTNNVTCLVPVHMAGEKGGYFLSAAESDRSISAWRFTGTSKTSQALASFSTQDEPLSLNVSRPTSEEDPIVLAVITVSGLLQIFEHHLNGRVKKPLLPKMTLHIASDAPGVAKSLPLLAAYPCGDVDGQCLIVYGSLVCPGFEKVSYRSSDAITYLIRRDPQVMEQSKLNDASAVAMKTKTPILPSDVKTLAPEHMVPSTISSESGQQNRKRRPLLSESACSTKDSLPMEQRLSALNLDRAVDAVAPPQADNLAQLLLQGLHSRDTQILQSVLDRGDPQMIANTIRRVPVQAVLPLLLELTRMMQYRGHPNHSYARWLRAVLEHHAGYLTSCPDLVTVLTPLLALMAARTALLPKMSQLRGRLDLMLGELQQRNEQQDASAKTTELPAEALLVYQDESSDEASEEGDWPLQSGSESEDQWDELSDIDNGESMDVNEIKEDEDSEIELEADDSSHEEDVIENGISD